MLSRIALLFVMISLGCAPEADHSLVLDVGEFAPYVERFETTAKANGIALKIEDLRIRFGRMDSPYDRGICDITTGEPPTITLKQSAWNYMTEEEREALVFHEMGHCVLKRNHVQTQALDGSPLSLMYPYIIDGDTYLDNQEHYHSELFAKIGR